jgi:hypothetical protein
VKTLIRPTKTIFKEVSVKEKNSVSPWIQVGVQLAVNIAALYIFQQVTLHIWRAITGH